MKTTVRGWVHTGYSCNQRCVFCSYQDSFIKEDKSLSTIKSELKKLKTLGMNDLTFSGGEVTLRSDIFHMLNYAKELGFKDILLITNGCKTEKIGYCKKLIEAGLTTITFSLEGYNAETHDGVTQVKGSFEKLIKSYKNMKKMGVNIRINVTITKKNYRILPQIAKLIKKLNPEVVNFLSYFGYDDAVKHFKEQSPKYSELKKYLKNALSTIDKSIPEINIRYLPYCIIPEYNHLITGYHQKVYQKYEWNNIADDILRHNRIVNYYHLIRGLLNYENKKKILKLHFHDLKNEAMIGYIISNSFTYIKKCKGCRYYYICNGFWKTYVKTYGADEFNPQDGKKIEDVLHFKRSLFKRWEKLKELHF